jgi:hypothetical protein
MEAKVILFIEGESNSPNGDLRQGFSKLLEQKLKGKLPKIILGDGKSKAIDKFKNNQLKGDLFLLLVDLDKSENERDSDLLENQLTSQKDNVFYMIQEMESWFLSQPKILDEFYGIDNQRKKVSEKLPKKKASDFANPDEKLMELTKNTDKGKYHKIKHGVELLKLLDATQLEKDFPDFKNLIAQMK